MPETWVEFRPGDLAAMPPFRRTVRWIGDRKVTRWWRRVR